ncbi:MAG: hypothetical protein H0V29_13185, partial [Thermoleophilaceae bacterium]|nr:hypothetical protein [Thermoleophilaceae bacterium]
MLDLLRELMDAAQGRVDYAEARHVGTRSEELSTRNGRVASIDLDEASGFGIR